MKLERVLLGFIIIGLVYVAYSQYNSVSRLFDKNLLNNSFLEGYFFKKEPRKKDVIKAYESRDEIKEIMQLTKLLHEVEKEVNEVYDQYDLIRINQNNLEYPGNKEDHLLNNIRDLRETIAYDRIRIVELKNKVATFKSSNSNLNQIKRQYIKILEAKGSQINNLQKRIGTLEKEIHKKGAIILEQKKVISDQKGNIQIQEEIIKNQEDNIKDREKDIREKQVNIEYQNSLIDKLSVKHVILYARTETIHMELDGNSFYLQNKISQLEIISEHPASSYNIRELNEGVTEFKILNTKAFWNDNNYILIRVKARKL